MKKRFTMKKKSKRPSAPAQRKPCVADLVMDMKRQLSAMEAKLDTLIGQPSNRPFEKSYSQRPAPRFNKPYGQDRGSEGYGANRERTFTKVVCSDCKKECEIPFKPTGDRPVYCRECLPNHKKEGSFGAGRGSRPEGRGFSSGPRRFDKRSTGKRPGADKKPFYADRKKRA